MVVILVLVDRIKQKLTHFKNWFLSLPLSKKIGWVVSAFVLAMLFFLILLRLCVSFELIGDLPSREELVNINNPLATELYASEGQLIGKYYVENRTPLQLSDINDNFKNALIATEDVRFFKHGGVDYKSLLRVAIKSILLQNDKSGGGSTLTQQLAKNLFPRQKFLFLGVVINKFREMSIARKLEKIYSKDEILLLYANTVSFGERAFGLNTASQRFFNKPPQELTLKESATLVGMLKATSYYSPRRNPERSRLRRNIVLSQMVKYNYLNANDTIGLLKDSIALDYTPLSKEEELARYFKQYVKSNFSNWQDTVSNESYKNLNLEHDGLKIYTTLDYDLQIAGERLVNDHMRQLQNVFLESWKGGRLFGKGTKIIDDQILSTREYKALRASGLNAKEALEVFTKSGPRSVWTWDGIEKRDITKIDSLKHYLSLLHNGLLACEPSTGKIKVWIGGNDYGNFQYDNIKSPRQVGSLFKPIVYLTALMEGKLACDYYKNELRNYTSYQDWTPRNADEEYGGYHTMKNALTHSVNTVSVQVLFDAGIPNVVQVANDLGIESPLNPVPSIVLGTSDVSLYEMVKSYSTIANLGVKPDLYCIERIENKQGEILYERVPVMDTLISSRDDSLEFATINAMLESVTLNGTGRRLYSNYKIPFTIKGKTGTTQNQSDGWFVGYTDDLVVGAWVGTEDRRIHFRNLGTGSGGRTALPLVGGLFEYAYDKRKIQFQSKDTMQFDCPDFMTDEEYVYYQSRKDREEQRSKFGGWLKDIFAGRNPTTNKRKSKDSRYDRMTTQERLDKIEKDRKKWERKLKKLKKQKR